MYKRLFFQGNIKGKDEFLIFMNVILAIVITSFASAVLINLEYMTLAVVVQFISCIVTLYYAGFIVAVASLIFDAFIYFDVIDFSDKAIRGEGVIIIYSFLLIIILNYLLIKRSDNLDENLREEDLIEEALDAFREMVVLTDKGKIVGCNNSLFFRKGVDRKNIMGNTVGSFLPTELNEKMLSYGSKDFDIKYSSAGDYYINVKRRLCPNGMSLYFIDYIEDYEEYMQRICTQEDKSKELLNIAPVSIFMHDNKRVYYKNSKAEDEILKNIKEEDIIRKAMLIQNLKRNKDNEKYIEEIIEIVDINGESQVMKMASKKIGGDKSVTVITDTSFNNRDKEDLLLLDEINSYKCMKVKFLGNISRALKEPIDSVNMEIQNIFSGLEFAGFDEVDKSRIETYLRSMSDNGNREYRLITNLIDIIEVDQGQKRLNLSNVEIVEFIRGVVKSVNQYAKINEIIIYFCSEIDSKVVAIDRLCIERVILNLISNSIKFTDKGGEIYVSIGCDEDNIKFEVRDTGTGIPSDKLESIFERFVQVDKSYRRKTEGSGVGLALVKSLVELHGGNVKVESRYGEGSNFIVSIPHAITNNGKYYSIKPYKKRNQVEVELSDIFF